ncbi:unnamed protein product [Hymenolepis diminuta]|uniref:Uncharacterized protein n=1 Tax=Hymenolepis diminuta TaxID=6216 RepID=A0A0R3SNF2_HYMDI|nr:unnamed protein product [Hymenolepis diminuta]
MKVSNTLAILLVLAIVQTRAFFTLFEGEERQHRLSPDRQTGDPETTKGETQATEQQKQAGVSQEDITLLRRDIGRALERLRQTIERHGGRITYVHSPFQHPYFHPNQKQ